MSSVPSPLPRPQTRVVPEGVAGVATKPVTATPLIVAVAEPETGATLAGRVSTMLASKAVELPLLGIVTLYSITSPTVAGSVAGFPAGVIKLTVLAALRRGSVTVMLAVVPAPPVNCVLATPFALLYVYEALLLKNTLLWLGALFSSSTVIAILAWLVAEISMPVTRSCRMIELPVPVLLSTQAPPVTTRALTKRRFAGSVSSIRTSYSGTGVGVAGTVMVYSNRSPIAAVGLVFAFASGPGIWIVTLVGFSSPTTSGE